MYTVTLSNKDLIKTFKTDIREHFKMKALLLYHLGLQPSEYKDSPYYEYQYYVKDLVEILKEKNDQSSNDKYNTEDVLSNAKSTANSMMKSGLSKANFKAPKMPKI